MTGRLSRLKAKLEIPKGNRAQSSFGSVADAAQVSTRLVLAPAESYAARDGKSTEGWAKLGKGCASPLASGAVDGPSAAPARPRGAPPGVREPFRSTSRLGLCLCFGPFFELCWAVDSSAGGFAERQLCDGLLCLHGLCGLSQGP